MGCVDSRAKEGEETEIKIESTKELMPRREEKKDDVETQFELVLEQLDVPNAAVNVCLKRYIAQAKWKEIPKYNYEKRSDLALLELVQKDLRVPGEIYYGFWNMIKERREYKGVIILSHGSLIEGGFADGILAGTCRKITPNREVYEGLIKNELYNGQGKLTRPDGTYSEGNWLNGVQNGQGAEKGSDGILYEGEFRNGAKTGKGKLVFPDASVYEGFVVNGKQQGKGCLSKPSGERYDGDWVNGMKHGKGVAWYKNEDRYEGDFANNKKEGYGKLFR